ncbi:MAG: GntR family transcriptional regulator [Acidobacteriia bacterium]|nr:GntR family transcriptional regulator [Terriglobia bacterium]
MVRGTQSAAAQLFRFRLDLQSGVPVYRQLIDQLLAALATCQLKAGDQVPTVRQVAVDLAINPNTVVRAYKELEIRGVLATQQGTGTFIAEVSLSRDEVEHKRRLHQLVGEMVARAGGEGYSLKELMEALKEQRR